MRIAKMLVLILVGLMAFNSTAFGTVVCEILETSEGIDDVKNDGSSYTGGDGNEPSTIKVGFALEPGFDIYDITAVAARRCTNLTGPCGSLTNTTGAYLCNPISNCSGFTLPNGKGLTGFNVDYSAIGIADDGTGVQINLGIPNLINPPNHAPGTSQRVKVWITTGGSSAWPPGVEPWDDGTNISLTCKDL